MDAMPAANQELIAPPTITHDVTLVTTKKMSRDRVMGVPPEEFGIERNARDVKTANYCFHEVTTETEASLIAKGFDEEQVKSLETYSGALNVEQTARDSVFETSGAVADANSGTRQVRYTEHYIRLDYEGKGKTCLYQIITGGESGEVLKRDGKECIEPWDAMPFAAVTPVPVPHRFYGRSVADLVMDIQRIKTALMRGMLNNLYLHNNPRVEVAEQFAGPNTLDDLLVSRPGGVVRTKQPGGLNWQVVPDITGSIYPALEYLDTMREMRSGVTRQSQGVDANALQNQSATAVAQAFSASQAKMKLIARILAEGVRDMFSLLHGTIRKHGAEKATIRLRNNWVQVDPRQWKTRNDMTINVGLGTGGKAERVAHLMALANFQKELLLGGKSNLVDDQALYNTFKQLAKLMDYKNPDQFINDPGAKDPKTGQPLHPPPQPQPDPAVQVAQIKAQSDQQSMQIQVQLDTQADQRKAQIEATQAQADIATQDRKTQAEMIQSEREFELKRELALLEAALEKEKFEREEARKEREHQLKMQQQSEAHSQAMQSGAFKMVQGAEAHGQKMEAAQTKGDK